MRDKAILLFTLYLFTIDIVVAGKGFGISLKNGLFMLWDMCNTPYSRELVSRIRKPHFNFAKSASSWEALDRWFERGDTVGALVIPPNFERDLQRGRTARILAILDGSVVSTAMLSYSYLSSIVATYNRDLLLERYKFSNKRPMPHVDARPRVMFNQNLNNEYYSGVVELLMNVTMITIILSSLVFVRERDYGTLEQIRVSPLSFETFAIAKGIFVLTFMMLCVTLGVILPLKSILRVPFRGDAVLFGVISLVAIVFNIGIGLIIAGFAKRMSQVGLLTVLFLAPMLFLSGGWVPPESMPSWLRPITDFSPLKYYLELGLGVMLKGLSFKECLGPLLRFLLLSILCLVVGYAALGRRLSIE